MTKHINQQLSDANMKVVIALAGGGYGVLGKLARPGGLSNTLLEASILSDPQAFIAFNRGRPDRFVSSEAARSLAMAAYRRCLAYAPSEQAIGFASTASLAKAAWEGERQGRYHHCNIAIQTSTKTASFYIKLGKVRDRIKEEMVLEDCLYRLFLGAVGTVFIENKNELTLNALEGEDSIDWEFRALQEWDDLTAGDICDVIHGREHTTCGTYVPKALFSSSLNPIHEGHIAVIERASKELGCKVDVELCVTTPDKPPLDYISINKRIGETLTKLRGNPHFGRLIVSNRSSFVKKGPAYPGATFIVGDDTISRIAMPHYYKGTGEYLDGLEAFGRNGNRFLVFPREHEILPPPSYWLPLATFVTKVKDFSLMNISSSQIRKENSDA